MAKEESAITYLYNETYNSVFQAIRPLIKDEDTALDVLQDTYIKAFESLSQLEKPEQFRAWVKRIAQNKSKDWLKKKKPTLFSEMRPDDDSGEIDFLDDREFTQPDVTLDKDETRRLLWEIIDSLSDEQRLVVSMYYFQEMQVKEIALELGISENTVKSRLNYARKNIESKVLVLEKQGTKLYSLAPIPFLLWLMRFGMETPSAAALTEITGAIGVSGTAAAASAGGAATGATATSGTAAGGAVAGASITAKIIAGIVAVAIVIGGGVALYQTLTPDEEPVGVVSQTNAVSPVPEVDIEELNAERIFTYLGIVEELGSGEYDYNRYLLYDYDGDGLDELLTATFDSTGLTADIFTVNESGVPIGIFSYADSGIRIANNFFVLLTLKGDDYLAYARAEVSGGTGVIYGTYYLLGETNSHLEAVHKITWIDFVDEDARAAYEQGSHATPYYKLDGEEMDADDFKKMKETAVFLEEDSLTYSEFMETYQ
ncbi:sigma-70 family RNA polymerase sigma factor [Oscillospiraceae bacterium OttesenSCG-928-G22]|nr:sigma-70 family RNA polymerase sigma factor [Oscillospiraceae bacterium OttesenSCG-928-G22]